MVQTKRVCCCGVRTWALGIGWYHTILSGLNIVQNSLSLVIICAFPANHSNKAYSDLATLRFSPKDQNKPNEHFNENCQPLKEQRKDVMKSISFPLVLVGVIAVLLILSVLNMVSGIVLITGVKQEKTGRLMTFIISHAALLFFSSVTSLILMYLTSSANVFKVLMISFLVDIFFIWVVNVHRKEILARRPVPVPI